MAKSNREENILRVVTRIEQSELSPEAYIQRYKVPFSIAQFYRYRNQLSTQGKEGLRDRRRDGNHKKLGKEEMVFIRGFIKDRAGVSPSEAMRAVAEEFGTIVHRSTMSRVLKKLGVQSFQRASEDVKKDRVSCAGFELIAALAIYLRWPEHTAQCVMDVIRTRAEEPQPGDKPDKHGRNAKGQFTKEIQPTFNGTEDAICVGRAKALEEGSSAHGYFRCQREKLSAEGLGGVSASFGDLER